MRRRCWSPVGCPSFPKLRGCPAARRPARRATPPRCPASITRRCTPSRRPPGPRAASCSRASSPATICRRTSRAGQRSAGASAGWRRACTLRGPDVSQQLPRVMGLRDVVLFNISAIVGLRWLTTAASQFGLASLLLWLVAMVVFFLPSAVAGRELADIDPAGGGGYSWGPRAVGPPPGLVAACGGLVHHPLLLSPLPVSTA